MGLDMRSSFPSRVSNRTRSDSASWLSCSFFKTTLKNRPILGNTRLTTGKEQCHHKKAQILHDDIDTQPLVGIMQTFIPGLLNTVSA